VAPLSSANTFTGLRVLEFTTTIAGPYSAMILADLGADVIKVERPGRGDDARGMPPHLDGASAVFHAVNHNKRSVVLDVKEAAGREAFLRLAGDSDVVVQSFRPGAAERLGLGFDDVHARNPRAVYCSVSAFGTSGGGLAGYDPLVQAFTGIMSMTGEPGGAPVRVAPSLVDLTTGMWAAIAIMAALGRRTSTGVGEHVEATLVDSGYALLCHQIVGMYATGEVPGPLGSASPITAPYESFGTADGQVMIAAGNDRLFGLLCAALGIPALATDPRCAVAAERVRHRDLVHAEVQRRVGTLTTGECLERLRTAGVPVAPVNDLRQAVEDPVAVSRGTVRAPDEPGGLPSVRLPFHDRGTVRRRAPRLGEHSVPVLRAAGYSDEDIARLSAPG
jgi:crotonobetainyl-CoA:carnitine CoA-transferase CaiB-like acyl-CoA transferase